MIGRFLQWFGKNGMYAAMAGVLAACVGLFSWIGYTKFSGETKKQKEIAERQMKRSEKGSSIGWFLQRDRLLFWFRTKCSRMLLRRSIPYQACRGTTIRAH